MEILEAFDLTGSERTVRRAVADAKTAWRAGNRRVHRPWVTEPGLWLWLQFDFGDGPLVNGVKVVLFVAWLAFNRFRVVIPTRDKTIPSVFAALDRRVSTGSSTPPTRNAPSRSARTCTRGSDELMPKTTATATVDRLLHHAHPCQTAGESVRLAQALSTRRESIVSSPPIAAPVSS